MDRDAVALPKRLLSASMAAVLAVSLAGVPAYAVGDGVADERALQQERTAAYADSVVEVGTAADLPASIDAGTTVELTADITLAEGQQIASIVGVLDGRGHTITLAGAPLAADVSGTVQNVGVTSDGVIASGENLGSLTPRLTGTIQNCWSTASLKLDGWMGEVGGLVGEIDGGTVCNSYFAGSIDAMMCGGIVGTGSAGTVANNVYTVGNGPISMGYGSLVKENNAGPDEVDIATAAALDYLNTNAPDTGFTWVSQGGLPQLVSADAPVEVSKDALAAAVEAAKALSESAYTSDSWQPFAEALAAAETVLADDAATQQQVNDAVSALTEAQGALQKVKPTFPIAVPADATHIATQDDLSLIDPADESAFYVLDADVTITDKLVPLMVSLGGALAGTFDGQGHTITFDRAAGAKQLFAGVAATGVVQNVGFAGEMVYESGNKLASGPLGIDMEGAVLNCYTEVSGDNIVGLARTLKGGAVSNVYSCANGTKVGGVLFASYEAGTLMNVYWQDYLANPATFPADALGNAYSLDPAAMRLASFTELMNANRGAWGVQWGQGQDGYPRFGAGFNYADSGVDIPADRYPVVFADNEGVSETVAAHVLEVSPDAVAADRQIGTLSLADVPEGSAITWATDDANRGNIGVNEETGQLYVYGNASGTVTATEHLADGTERPAATVIVQAKAQPIDDFQIWFAGENVTDGSIAVSGSEVRNLEVRVHYVDAPEGEFVPVSFTRFVFEGSDASTLYANDYSACFYFKQQGTASIAVTSRSNPELGAKRVTVTSERVGATGISMGYAEDGQPIVLHGRNPLSSGAPAGGAAFLTDKARPVVSPDNASNRDNFTVTSSDPAVAQYTASGDIGYTPYAAGTATFTATLPDVDPATGKPFSASVNATYEYLNPLVSVTAAESDLTVKGGTHTTLDLQFSGKRDAEGYSVTEPGLVWTYSEDGIVDIDRTVKGAWKHEAGAPDDGLYLASSDYTLTALKPGTVTAVGTPVDATAGAKPVTLTITVDGIAPSADVDKLVDEGIDSATRYLDSQRAADAYQYGSEWEIYTFLKAGRAIDPAMLETYRASVAASKDVWEAVPTSTERVGLALAAMGVDITNVDGVNLVDVVCNDEQLGELTNQLVYALRMIDEAQVEVPSDAVWTRDALVDAVASSIGADGAAVNPGDAGDVDMTAMALQALAPYADRPNVSEAISRGLAYLCGVMNKGTCDFGSAESDAQVLLALTALNMNPLSTANGFANESFNLITAIMSYNVDPGFSHTAGDAANMTASVQVLQALTSYKQAAGAEVAWGDNGDTVKPGKESPQQPGDPSTTPQVPAGPTNPSQPSGGEGAGQQGSSAGAALANTGDSGAMAALALSACAGLAAAIASGAAMRAQRRARR